MIQGGDPNTKNPDKSVWGQGGPGYLLPEEFNTIQHDRGIVSMARGQHPNSAGSQFFIVHEDSNFLDGKYTAFGRLVPGTHSLRQLDNIASLETNNQDVPLNVFSATIEKATVLDSWTRPSFLEQPDSNPMLIKEVQTSSGKEQKYINSEHQITFHLPYRWMPVEADGMTSDRLDLILQPTIKEHNAQKQIVEKVLERSDSKEPYDVIANAGDPMIPFVAGMLSTASEITNVILAGGTQMAAVPVSYTHLTLPTNREV